MKPSILLVTVDPALPRHLEAGFAGAGLAVRTADGVAAALAGVQRDRPALVVLDEAPGDSPGRQVGQALRREKQTARIPLILLGEGVREADRIAAFEAGMDDFVAKPVSPRELVLRVQAILRRTNDDPAVGSEAEEGRQRIGVIDVDRGRHVARVDGALVALTAREFCLMLALVDTGGRTLSREQLLERVWGLEAEVEIRTVDTHVRRLREKLGAAGGQIRTVRGFGYRLTAEGALRGKSVGR